MKYRNVVKYITDYIEQNHLAPGQKLPSESELARELDYSRVTIRRAFQELLDTGVIYRVQGSGSFVKDQSPPQEEQQKAENNIIPIILPFMMVDPHSLSVVQGAESYFTDHGIFYSVHFSRHDPQVEKNQIQNLVDNGCRCMIVFPESSSENRDFFFHLMEKGIQIVFIDRLPSYLSGNLVSLDNFRCGYLAGKHLAEVGCRRTAVITYEDAKTTSAVPERIEGFVLGQKEGGLVFDRKLLFKSGPRQLEGDMETLMAENVDGIMCVNGNAGTSVMEYLLKHGIQVPEQVAVITIDNLTNGPLASEPLSDVYLNFCAVGYAAAELAARCLKEPMAQYVHRVIPVKLIPRQSTAR